MSLSSTTGVDASKVMRTPGRICVDPTSLSGSFPYGGTALGGVRSVSKVVERQVAFAPDLERGGIQESFEGPVRIRLSCILRETNDAVISTLFRSAVTGGVSTVKGIAMPQAADLPGKKGTDRAVKLLWVPLNTADYPAIYIPRAIPVQTTDMSKLGAFSERTRFVEFEAARDASDRLYLEQLIEDMTL